MSCAQSLKDAMHEANVSHDPKTVTRFIDKAQLKAEQIETHYRFADRSALVVVFGHGTRGMRVVGWGLEKPANRKLVSATSRSQLRRLFLQRFFQPSQHLR